MNNGEEKKAALQWHPAFFASLQIELADYAEDLIFENEHQLGTKPMEIDVLVIKKETTQQIQKNIGKIFRRYNIIEYKSPADYLCVDDFYKVYGYACFYKADTVKVNSIPIEEITISFVCQNSPQKFIRHLKNQGYKITLESPGIYYISGAEMAIQLIVSSKLPEEENLWLKSLTDKLSGPQTPRRLLSAYEEHKGNTLYVSAMNIIVNANLKEFKEAKNMAVCSALRELMKEEIEEMKAQAISEGRQEGWQEAISILIETYAENNLPQEAVANKLRDKFQLSEEQIQTLINKYWDK